MKPPEEVLTIFRMILYGNESRCELLEIITSLPRVTHSLTDAEMHEAEKLLEESVELKVAGEKLIAQLDEIESREEFFERMNYLIGAINGKNGDRAQKLIESFSKGVKADFEHLLASKLYPDRN